MSETVNIKELNERIKQESEFVDLVTMEMQILLTRSRRLAIRVMISCIGYVGQETRIKLF